MSEALITEMVGDGTRAGSRAARLSGLMMLGVATLFLGIDAAMKLLQTSAAMQGTAELGYPAAVVFPLGLLQLGCLVVLLIPRTAVFGAVLWTGYLGGAIATHVRLENPLFTHVLFPAYVAILIWGGLWLRDRRVRDIARY